MDIIIGKTAGFCFGVKNAIEKTIEELEEKGNIYCLGELVHNKQVTEELINKGVRFIDDIHDSKGTTIIRAHGIPKKTYKEAENLHINLKDLTCKNVIKIHNIAEEYAKKNYFIFLIGQRKHPETIGTISFCGRASCVIQGLEDIDMAVEKFKKSKADRALVITQTTFGLEEFNKIIEKLKEKTNNIEVKNTICNATKMRQEETEKIAREVDVMIIIGGKHSSNSNKLWEISKKYCNNVLFIETKEELDLGTIKNAKKVGIMAGASTPQKSIKEIVDIIKRI